MTSNSSLRRFTDFLRQVKPQAKPRQNLLKIFQRAGSRARIYSTGYSVSIVDLVSFGANANHYARSDSAALIPLTDR